MWYYNNGRRLSKAKEELYWTAYRYLRKHAVWMQLRTIDGKDC